MVFTIAGASGQVGGATAGALVAAGVPTRVVLRDRQRLGSGLAGADVAEADLRDRRALAAALAGSDGCFVLLPFNPTATTIAADQERMIESITAAVADAAVPHVAMLSSLGAESADGPRILSWLHTLENGLRGTGAVVSVLRCTHFQEKVGEVLDAARAGSYPVFGEELDTPVPMVATTDVAAQMAATLQAPPATHQVTDVLGPMYTERQLAARVGETLGTSLAITSLPRAAWVDTLTDAGLSGEAAELVAELYDAAHQGKLSTVGDRQVVGETPIETTLQRLL